MKVNTIYNENCLDTMKRMPSEYIDLTVTSPPYDGLRDYNGYSFPFEDIATELFRVTKKGGVVVWVVGDSTINGSESGTSFRQALYFMNCGFNLHDTMIWKKPNPIPTQKTRYQQAFEYMFILSKGKPKTFNPIKIKSKCAGVTVKKHRSIKGRHNYNNEGDYTVAKEKIIDNVWQIPNVTNKTGHPAIFPNSLAENHIITWSNDGDLIYDPFGGSGTTANMAHFQNRNWILSEISTEYCKIAKKIARGFTQSRPVL